MGAPGTVAVVAAKALDIHTILGGVAFVVQCPALWTGDGAGVCIVMEVLSGVGIVLGRLALGRWSQNRHLFVGGGSKVCPAAVTGIGHRQGVGRGNAEVLPRLLDHRRQLVGVGLLTGGLAGD